MLAQITNRKNVHIIPNGNIRNDGTPIKAIEQILKFFFKKNGQKLTEVRKTLQNSCQMINASKRIPTAFRFLGVDFVPLGQTGSEYTFAGKK